MLNESITIEGLGELSHSGKSRHWSGSVNAAATHRTVELTIDGTPSGPADIQVDAIKHVVTRWDDILAEATSGLVELLEESELPETDPWVTFEVSSLSVPAISYDPDGAVHVHINLIHVDYPDDFWPAIDIVDGTVREILSGT